MQTRFCLHEEAANKGVNALMDEHELNLVGITSMRQMHELKMNLAVT